MAASISDTVKGFFEHYPPQTFVKGQILVYAHEDPKGVFYVEQGLVRQYDISKSGDEIVLNVFKPGAFLPMSWAINQTPNQYFFQAAEASIVRRAPRTEAVQFLQDNPVVMFDLLARVYSGVDGLLKRMNYLMSTGATERVLLELSLASDRFGKSQADGSRLVTITELELGARAGLTRETISRELTKLKRQGLVAVRTDGLHILRPDELQQKLS